MTCSTVRTLVFFGHIFNCLGGDRWSGVYWVNYTIFYFLAHLGNLWGFFRGPAWWSWHSLDVHSLWRQESSQDSQDKLCNLDVEICCVSVYVILSFGKDVQLSKVMIDSQWIDRFLDLQSLYPLPPGVLLWGGVSCRKICSFNVKVTARAYIIKIWLFPQYLLNCWSICNQIWFDSTAS